jgi:hypothetical protein
MNFGQVCREAKIEWLHKMKYVFSTRMHTQEIVPQAGLPYIHHKKGEHFINYGP